MSTQDSPKAIINHPDEFYLPDSDFLRVRPLNVIHADNANEKISQEHVGAEREVASIAHNLISGPNGNMAVYLVKPKSMRLFINQARAVTAWHGPSTSVMLLMNNKDKACLVASVSKQQMLWIHAHEWVENSSKLLEAQHEGDSRLALGVEGKVSSLRDTMVMTEAFARKRLGLN